GGRDAPRRRRADDPGRRDRWQRPRRAGARAGRGPHHPVEHAAMTDDIPLTWFLYFASAAFAIGLFGVLVRRNAVAALMALEIMLNPATLNLLAFWRYGPAPRGEGPLTGVMMALFVITIAAAEVAVGIGLILLCYRRWKAADVDRYDSMAG